MRIVLLFIIFSVASSWVIYRKNHKKKLVCREEPVSTNGTGNDVGNIETPPQDSDENDSDSSERETKRRQRRDIDVDPIHKEPIIYLGGRSNSTVFIDDGDFDIVSDHLTDEELNMVKQQIMDTCNALNSH